MIVTEPVVALLVMLLDDIPLGILEKHVTDIHRHAINGGTEYKFESELQVASAKTLAAFLAAAQLEIHNEETDLG